MLTTLLYIILVFNGLVLAVAILLQDGKGGGVGDALGSAGRETIGAGSRGPQKFTAAVAILFLLTTLGIHLLNRA